MQELELKYGCNPNQKPARLFIQQGELPLTVLNGKRSENALSVARYAEVIGSHTQARDVLTGTTYALDKDFSLSPRAVLVLEF